MLPALQRLLLTAFGRLPVWVRRRLVRWGAPSYTVGSMCLIQRGDGRILLIRQRYRNRWGMPGGLLKRGEESADAARREVREEVGLDVDVAGDPAVVVAPHPQRVDVVYRAVPRPGQDLDGVRARSPEILTAEWFRVENLPELQDETVTALVAIARGEIGSLARTPGTPEQRHG